MLDWFSTQFHVVFTCWRAYSLCGNIADNPTKRTRHGSAVDTSKKKPNRSEEGIKSKKDSDRRRGQTRVCIGDNFTRWRDLTRDTEAPAVLL